MVLGMAAIAGGEVGDVSLGGVDMVEGIGQRFFNGPPHSSGFPENDFLSWLMKTLDSGISPVKLLKERSMVAFVGNLFPNSTGMSPESLL